MSKKVFKVFIDAIDGQEKWINKMAAKGFRLCNTTRFFYEFEECVPLEYKYKVEFVAEKSPRALAEYRSFLSELGIQSITKAINLGKISFGQVRLRLYGEGMGKIATFPGSINSELLILEKKNDGKDFEVHTDASDVVVYYKRIRKALLQADIMLIILLIYSLSASVSIILKLMLAAIIMLITTGVIKYSSRIRLYKRYLRTNQ